MLGIYTSMATFDPYDVKASVQTYNVDALEADEFFRKSTDLANQVHDLWKHISDNPRWSNLFSQAVRAAESIPLNYAEGQAKLLGYCRAGYLTARGSAYELYAALSIGPESFRALKPTCKVVIASLDAAILQLPERSDRAYWKNR